MKENEFNKLLGQRIKKLRKAKGFSQELLAEKIDKSVDAVSNIERGIFAPRIDTALDIARALDVQLFELFKIEEIATEDAQKTALLEEIVDLLKEQPNEILQFTLTQTKTLTSLTEKFIDKLRK
ncbi:MAG: helix-turn-helix transcriptional regulator [Alphaproteobacteria bacterium]|jgi:transcriptional regulator with XRE-family HTH domain|nr:helix-turn-helix transcriptional regulator [Alphaproteobacteria bacterium]MDP7222126.1 helix-turn-helix transcriptional regulator [Alphaproteobacteria bacterium]